MFFHHRTIQALSRLIQGINTTPPWQEPERFFSALNQVIPFDYSVGFMKFDAATQRVVPFPFTLSNGGANDAAVVGDYNTYFWRLKQPIIHQILKRRLRAFHLPASPAAYLSKAQFEEYRFDFWEKHHVRFSSARYFKTRHGWLSVYLSRSPGSRDFTDEEQRLFDLLVPHLELTIAGADLDLPVLFADLQGKIVSTDPIAEAALKSRPAFAMELHKALPVWIARQIAAPLQPLSVEMNQGKAIYRFTLSRAGTGRTPLFRVRWKEEKAAAVIGGPFGHLATAINLFARQHRFSRREREVAALAVDGKQMKEMAQTLGLAVDTVKEYLASAYRKAGVDGRGPLVARILGSGEKAPTSEGGYEGSGPAGRPGRGSGW